MFFLGYTSVLGGSHSLDGTVTNVSNITSIKLKNQICDNLFVTKSTDSLSSPLNKTWDYKTLLSANFQGNLQAGNIGYLLSSISAVRVKLREKGTYNWINLSDVPITKAEDLEFSYFTYIARGGKTEYEGALVPIINGAEGNLNISSVVSDFNGLFVCEKDKSFNTELDVVITPTRNRPSATLTPLTGKYPITIHNSSLNYDSGTTQAVFVNRDADGYYLKSTAYKYRDQLKDFLFDGKYKIMKYQGQIWLISVIDNIPEDSSQKTYEDYTKLTFSWNEEGSISDAQDLYDFDLIDVDPESI